MQHYDQGQRLSAVCARNEKLVAASAGWSGVRVLAERRSLFGNPNVPRSDFGRAGLRRRHFVDDSKRSSMASSGDSATIDGSAALRRQVMLNCRGSSGQVASLHEARFRAWRIGFFVHHLFVLNGCDR
jgi:hypothetical protein